jgi:hypothetical protein
MRSNPMEAKEIRTCGAKTRAGSPCKRRPTWQGRCHLHGGKSFAWMAHPNYKHGWYSKYVNREILVILLNNQGYYANSWGGYLRILQELNSQSKQPSGDTKEV